MGFTLLDAYDYAAHNRRRTAFMPYLGTQIGVAAEEGQVRVWLATDTDVEHVFDVSERQPTELLDDVDDFITEHR